MNAGEVPLAVIGVLTSVVSVYYYLRIPVLMYMHELGHETNRGELSTGEIFVLGVCAFAVVFLGLFPNAGWLPVIGDLDVMDWARQAVSQILPPG